MQSRFISDVALFFRPKIATRRWGTSVCHLAPRRLRALADGRPRRARQHVERAIRPQAIIRKNSLFAGSDGGGRTGATVATLLQTAKMNAVDPQAWLTQTLERLANGWPSSKIDALMPWNYKAWTASASRLPMKKGADRCQRP